MLPQQGGSSSGLSPSVVVPEVCHCGTYLANFVADDQF